METILNYLLGYCYVVIANENGKLKECITYYKYDKAIDSYVKLKNIYGIENVYISSGKIGSRRHI